MISSLPIVAPVASLEEAEEVLRAGASELYCGILPEYWIDAFGLGDLLTRRQGRISHFSSFSQLEQLLALATKFNASVALTLNVNYSKACEGFVGDIAARWEQIGGKRIIACDIGLLLMLKKTGSRLRRHLSLMANVYNASAVKFYQQFGVKRIILPRHLSFSEIKAITSSCQDMEYEILVMCQKCPFMDGFCGFYHDQCLAHDVPVAFDYECNDQAGKPIVRALDVNYEGHGCRLSWKDQWGNRIRYLSNSESAGPSCGACYLNELNRSGINYVKIAGRGMDGTYITDVTKFLIEAGQLSDRKRIRKLYADTFESACRSQSCYFSDIRMHKDNGDG